MRECLRLRVKDIDCSRREITVHDGKGGKDRTTLPAALDRKFRNAPAEWRWQ